jgi:hypothetical protein
MLYKTKHVAYKTNKELKLDGRYSGLTVPQGTTVIPINEGATAGHYWVNEFKWIADQTGFPDSMQKWDAVHYGITVAPGDVEEVAS